MIKMSTEDKEVVGDVRALSGFTEGEVVTILKSLVYKSIGSFSDSDGKLTIPFLGTFYLKFDGFEVNEDMTRSTKVTGSFVLNEDFTTNIGLVEDWKEDGDDSKLLELDSYKHIRDNINSSLKMKSE